MKKLTLAHKALGDSQIANAKSWLEKRESVAFEQNKEQCIRYAIECLERYEDYYSPSLEEMISKGEGNLEQR